MVNKFQKGLSGTIQYVPQIEALRTPLHVELSELLEGKVTLKESCASPSKNLRYESFKHTPRLIRSLLTEIRMIIEIEEYYYY